MKRVFAALVLAAIMAAGGCGRSDADWWYGEWEFDRERSEQPMKQRLSRLREGNDELRKKIGGKNGVDSFVSLMEQVGEPFGELAGTKVRITSEHLRMTSEHGTGQRFTVSTAPSRDSLAYESTEGGIFTARRDGERFWIPASGNPNIRLYFRRLENR